MMFMCRFDFAEMRRIQGTLQPKLAAHVDRESIRIFKLGLTDSLNSFSILGHLCTGDFVAAKSALDICIHRFYNETETVVELGILPGMTAYCQLFMDTYVRDDFLDDLLRHAQDRRQTLWLWDLQAHQAMRKFDSNPQDLGDILENTVVKNIRSLFDKNILPIFEVLCCYAIRGYIRIGKYSVALTWCNEFTELCKRRNRWQVHPIALAYIRLCQVLMADKEASRVDVITMIRATVSDFRKHCSELGKNGLYGLQLTLLEIECEVLSYKREEWSQMMDIAEWQRSFVARLLECKSNLTLSGLQLMESSIDKLVRRIYPAGHPQLLQLGSGKAADDAASEFSHISRASGSGTLQSLSKK
eukprot:GFYU01006911.1.p1 GENE.GFYU01006911.1~~GFYU01006911.1.p1  ORF type:complete len:358 (-),score=102.05 GFYU01006911.1:235-1308(-)